MKHFKTFKELDVLRRYQLICAERIVRSERGSYSIGKWMGKWQAIDMVVNFKLKRLAEMIRENA